MFISGGSPHSARLNFGYVSQRVKAEPSGAKCRSLDTLRHSTFLASMRMWLVWCASICFALRFNQQHFTDDLRQDGFKQGNFSGRYDRRLELNLDG
jgi:hypothetical protein